MAASEYLAFLPLLIYGIAIADLFSEWKRFFDPKGLFIPYGIFTVILTEIAAYNIFVFAKLLDQLSGITYYNYLTFLIPPFIFLLTVNVYTPEKDTDTKVYFMRNIPSFFMLLALFSSSQFLYDFDIKTGALVIRIIGILLFTAAAIIRKIWVVYLIIGLWAILLIFRVGVVSI